MTIMTDTKLALSDVKSDVRIIAWEQWGVSREHICCLMRYALTYNDTLEGVGPLINNGTMVFLTWALGHKSNPVCAQKRNPAWGRSEYFHLNMAKQCGA